MLNQLIDFISFHPRALRIVFLILLGLFIHFYLRQRQRAKAFEEEPEIGPELEALLKVQAMVKILTKARKKYLPDPENKPVLPPQTELEQSECNQPELAQSEAEDETDAKAEDDGIELDPEEIELQAYARIKIDPRKHRVTWAPEKMVYTNLFLNPTSLIHFNELFQGLLALSDKLSEPVQKELKAFGKDFSPLLAQIQPSLLPHERLKLGVEKNKQVRQWRKQLQHLQETLQAGLSPADAEMAEKLLTEAVIQTTEAEMAKHTSAKILPKTSDSWSGL